MLTHFERMWEGRLGLSPDEQQRMKIEKTNNRRIHPAPHFTGPKARKFEKQEINPMIGMDITHVFRSEERRDSPLLC